MSPIRSSCSISGRSSRTARRARFKATSVSSRPISASKQRPLEMLQLTAIESGYRDVTVLHGIDLEVRAGEIVALIGPNGAGKTTLARTIAGLLPVRRGQIRFAGEPVEPLPPWTRIRLGMAHAPEGRQVVAGLTVADNLRLGAYAVRRRRNESWTSGRIAAVCELFPVLRERLGDPAGNLSGGQQQMLAI